MVQSLSALLMLFGISACVVADGSDKSGASSQTNAEIIRVGGADIELIINGELDPATHSVWTEWVKNSLETVSRYYGRFPVQEAAINLIINNGKGIRTGKAMQGKIKPQILIWIGEQSDARDLKEDWVLVHELIHLATATLPRKHHWLEEGLSVYIESIARAQAGELSADTIWREFVKRMPNGQPEANDRGLDRTPTWGRTYWGGAVFCLLVDVAIRQQSENKQSLKDAVRNVVEAGLTMNKNASLSQVLDAMDADFSKPVVRPIYEQYAEFPRRFELDSLWQNLGISLNGNRVNFDDSASLAHVRRDITRAN